MTTEEYKDEEGTFFRTYINQVQNSLSQEEFDQFSNLKTDQERVEFIYKFDIIHTLALPQFVFGKHADKALQFKNIGNKLYGQSQFGKAAKNYWMGLLECPVQEGGLLATLHANRSACLYNMQEYREALEDIEAALDLPYPSGLHHKVHERSARCHMALDELPAAVAAFKRTLAALDAASDLSTTARLKKSSDCAIMIELLTKTVASCKGGGKVPAARPTATLPPLPALTNGCNEQYPSASSAVRFSANDQEGRYAVAGEPIDAGDVLLVERAHCAALLFQYSRTHCQHCLGRVRNPLACPGCTAVVFCSVECRSTALRSYHMHECAFLGCLLTEGASINCCLAVRLVTQRPLAYFLDARQRLEGTDSRGLYLPSDYGTVYGLCTHVRTRTTRDFLQRATMAVILLRFLQRSGYFTDSETTPLLPARLSPAESYVGGLLLRHLQLLQFNAHEISELQFNAEQPGELSRAESTFIAGGLFPTLALFNHSCEPAIVRYFSGSHVVVRAVRPLVAGELVAENYGPIYTQAARDTRRAQLRTRYWFECGCVPCNEDWPLFVNMTMQVLPFRCTATALCRGHVNVGHDTDEFMFKCPRCSQMICIFAGLRALNDTGDMFNKGERLLADHRYEEALSIFLKIMKTLSGTLKPPYRDLCLCQQKIRSSMLTLGNRFQLASRH